MNQLEYQREIAAFEEKIALAELEETKAKERKDELKYQKSRFLLDFLTATVRAQARMAQEAQEDQPSESTPAQPQEQKQNAR